MTASEISGSTDPVDAAATMSAALSLADSFDSDAKNQLDSTTHRDSVSLLLVVAMSSSTAPSKENTKGRLRLGDGGGIHSFPTRRLWRLGDGVALQ